MTLDDLKRMSMLVSMRRLAAAVGMNASTLKHRLRRGSPELTADESSRIADALAKAGIEPPSPPPKTGA